MRRYSTTPTTSQHFDKHSNYWSSQGRVIGLKTTMRTTRIYDAAGNSLVENAIQRIRNVAATLRESLTESTGLRFSSQHPLWTWACRHGAWLLNRFQPFQGSTSYELCQGRTHEGKLCEYGKIALHTRSPSKDSKQTPDGRLAFVWERQRFRTLG